MRAEAAELNVRWHQTDLSRERDQALEHLEAVRTELQDNRDLLERYAATCEGSNLAANRQLLALMGPSPDPVPLDSVSRLIRLTFASPPPSLRTIAFDATVASGALVDVGSQELQTEFRTWEAVLRTRESRVSIFNANLEKTVDYLVGIGLFGPSVSTRVALPESRFALEVQALLSDPVLEGWLRNMAIRRGQVCLDDVRRAESADSLLRVVSTELAR
jgi:hypothetical protein